MLVYSQWIKNILYAGTFGAGIYRSSDQGNNWEEINKVLLGRTIYSLTIKDENL
jgi:hypothetical protein